MKKTGCAIYIFIIALNLTIGTWSVIEVLSWFGKSIPTLACVIIGLFTGEFSIPLAIVGKILKSCGVF